MTKKWKLTCLSLALITTGLATVNFKALGGITTGADIYCMMRQGGNDHETSWIAAYTNIKKQRTGIFKTSPRQAANMIVEQVVANPTQYEVCINFLGDLYKSNMSKPPKDKSINSNSDVIDSSSEGVYEDRYSY